MTTDLAWLSALRQCVAAEDVLSDSASCWAYSYDNTRQMHLPQAVVFARDTAQVAAVVRVCYQWGVPVVARGRGTGTAGGSLPIHGGVVLSFERMNQVIKLDVANRWMRVQAGVLNAQVQQLAQTAQLFWPPDPSSAAFCTVGGNLATCAGGPRAVKYGVTRDHVLGLTAVTGKGEIIHTGGYTTKGVVGYDLTRLLIGSEGTLALITEATLKLTPRPEAACGVVAHYASVAAAAQAITRLMAQPLAPCALEFLDAGALALLRTRHPQWVHEQTVALLMIEVDGSHDQVETLAQQLAAVAQEGAQRLFVTTDMAQLWAARKALSPLLRQIAPKKINEDVVVPVATLPQLLAALAQISSRYAIRNVNFGHAGNGNVHVNLLVNPDNPLELARAHEALAEIFQVVLALQGSLSGEHGVGTEKRPFVSQEIDAITLSYMHGIKKVFDPGGILNSGKALPDLDEKAATHENESS